MMMNYCFEDQDDDNEVQNRDEVEDDEVEDDEVEDDEVQKVREVVEQKFLELKCLKQAVANLGLLFKMKSLPDLISISHQISFLEHRSGNCELKVSFSSKEKLDVDLSDWTVNMKIFAKNGNKRIVNFNELKIKSLNDTVALILELDEFSSGSGKLTLPLLVKVCLVLKTRTPLLSNLPSENFVIPLKDFEITHFSLFDNNSSKYKQVEAKDDHLGMCVMSKLVNAGNWMNGSCMSSFHLIFPSQIFGNPNGCSWEVSGTLFDKTVTLRIFAVGTKRNVLRLCIFGDFKTILSMRRSYINLFSEDELTVDNVQLDKELAARCEELKNKLEDTEVVNDLKELYISVRNSLSSSLPML